MSIAVIATVFALVGIAELPDKTMIATLLMGSRSERPALVWAGVSAAFTVHVALAVGAGRLVLLLPHRVLEIATTALFFAGAVYLLVVPERHEEEVGEAEAAGAEAVEAEAAGAEAAGPAGADLGRGTGPVGADTGTGPVGAGAVARGPLPGRAAWRVMTTAFGVVAVGELGDLTQILTLNLAARYRDPWSVFIGALLALVTVAAIGAWGGRALLRWLPLAIVRRAGGVVLAGFAAYGIYALAR